MTKNLFYLILIVTLFIGALCQAQESLTSYTPLDFDGDGISDYALFENQSDGSPNELVHEIELSKNKSIFSEEYGKGSDNVAYGDYNGDGIWEVVFVRDNDKTLDWYTYDSQESTVQFGLSGDILITGCDFDGDFVTDKAVIRESVLIVSQSSDTEEKSTDLELGNAMSIKSAMCADLNGDNSNEILLMGSRIESNGETKEIVKCKQTYRGKKKRRDCRVRNKAIREENKETSKRRDVLLVLDADGKLEARHKANKAKSIIIADINNDETYEVGFFKAKTKASRLQFFLAGAEAGAFTKEKIALPVGTEDASFIKRQNSDQTISNFLFIRNNNETTHLFDLTTLTINSEVDLSVFGDSLIQATNVHYTGSTVPEDPEGICPNVEDFSDGANGRVWKESDHGGTAVFVRPVCEGTSKRIYLMKDGKNLAEMYYTGLANADSCGLREHWRHNTRPGSFPAQSIIVVEKKNGETKCYQLGDNPGKRHD